MVRGGVCTVALALVLFCLAVVSNVEAGRTHELFAQSTYEEPESIDEAVAAAAGELKGVEGKLPMKTADSSSPTAQDSTATEPQGADAASTAIGATQNPESARAESTPSLVTGGIPQPQQNQQHYRDYRSTTTAPQGDYRADAQPWWFNSQYDNYGNYVQGRNPQQLDQQQQSQSIPNMRYPNGYPARYTGPQFFYNNPASGAQPYAAVQTSNGQYYSSIPQQQQYSQSRYSQSSGIVPYEMTAGGCPTQYWISNTQRWPAFFNVKTTVGDALGTSASKIFGETTLLQALLNTRPDGYSTLLRSASTAILNSYSRSQYKFSHVQVIESFATALGTSKAAAEQAASYEEANISAYREQYNSCV